MTNARIVQPTLGRNLGAFDFFLAGEDRWLGDDTEVGVHSWGSDDFNGNELPKDDPEHQSYIDFYNSIDIDEDFYWFTLQAADAEDMHNMSSDEREQYGVVTP